ncbi:accessory gene regulator ArgB-like protein [Paenibacillus graminis]|uniref:accessory gene regulator ArgB-like protein n=1 Tax=Paenibacillus graminis TaxID=189425 RepID=UPI002DB58707|nr:accessory gene regulator B family protein [Paenibacillus graminis]MEC0167422.1 accessory gene regulator B family protein [Paenibacillus graminis]
MIEYFALKLAGSIKKSVPDSHTSTAVMRFALSVIINASMIIILSLLISLITGKIKEATIALVAFPLLRQASGGYHLKSGMKCVLFSTALITVISLVDLQYKYIFIMGLLSIVLVAIYAPSNIEKQSRTPKKYYPLLKFISFVIVALNLFIGSSVLAAAFFAQSISLIRLKGGEQL